MKNIKNLFMIDDIANDLANSLYAEVDRAYSASDDDFETKEKTTTIVNRAIDDIFTRLVQMHKEIQEKL